MGANSARIFGLLAGVVASVSRVLEPPAQAAAAVGDGDPMAGVPASEPGIDGRLIPRDGGAPDPGQPMNGFVVTAGVASCDETIQKALDAGASIVFPKAPVPQVGWLAYLTDPEGDRFGVLEPDGSAA